MQGRVCGRAFFLNQRRLVMRGRPLVLRVAAKLFQTAWEGVSLGSVSIGLVGSVRVFLLYEGDLDMPAPVQLYRLGEGYLPIFVYCSNGPLIVHSSLLSNLWVPLALRQCRESNNWTISRSLRAKGSSFYTQKLLLRRPFLFEWT